MRFRKQGFEKPAEIDAVKHPYVRLDAKRELALARPFLVVDLEAESLARILAERFVIERNGSISERLWRLVTDPSGEDEPVSKEGLS